MSDEPNLDESETDGVFKCWCGAEGPFEELCDMSFLESGCGGTGSLNCFCGGDFCVCHNHGEVECPGCEDCERENDECFDDGDYDYGERDEDDPKLGDTL